MPGPGEDEDFEDDEDVEDAATVQMGSQQLQDLMSGLASPAPAERREAPLLNSPLVPDPSLQPDPSGSIIDAPSTLPESQRVRLGEGAARKREPESNPMWVLVPVLGVLLLVVVLLAAWAALTFL